ncbi:MAG: hypothetical protein GX536_00815 [Actinobacteria bacterium]|nr:hypothetical protein [Actinomycetota bacterium]
MPGRVVSPGVVIGILGPTGVGKTQVGIALAARLGVRVISCDSLQIYRGMPVLTNQPSATEINAVPHEMIGVADPTEEWSAARYAQAVRPLIDADLARVGHALLVGGTGLYMRAAVGPLAAPPPTPPALQAELEARAECDGPEALHRELALLDATAAASIHPRNVRRVVRALGALLATRGAVTDVASVEPSVGASPGVSRAPCAAQVSGKTAGGSSVMRSAEKVAGRMAQEGAGGAAQAGAREAASVGTGEAARKKPYQWSGRSDLWAPRYHHPTVLVGLTLPREELHRRINTRTREMLRAGAVQEAAAVLAAHPGGQGGRDLERGIGKAIGFRIIAEHLAGGLGHDEVEGRLAAATRGYARRQLTWMRKVPDIVIMDVSERDPVAVAADIHAHVRERSALLSNTGQ